LGHGLAVARDDHPFPILYRADQFGQTILGFGYADIHCDNYGYLKRARLVHPSSSTIFRKWVTSISL
jgi:hypothetical protein